MRKVRHKNVVQFIGACTRKPNLCIVFEFMSGGSVYDYIRRVSADGAAGSKLGTWVLHMKSMEGLACPILKARKQGLEQCVADGTCFVSSRRLPVCTARLAAKGSSTDWPWLLRRRGRLSCPPC